MTKLGRMFCRLLGFSFLWLLALPAWAEQTVAIDFSHAGYGGGGEPPLVAAVLRVEPSGGDDTAQLQAAIDALSTLPMRSDGFRGALELAPGNFRVGGALRLSSSGVVLRGAGRGEEGTRLVASGQGRRTLLTIAGTLPAETAGVAVVADAPAGARTLRVGQVEDFAPGEQVVVRRPSTAEWIAALGMDQTEEHGHFAEMRTRWIPGSRDLVWDRRVEAIDAEAGTLTLDAPITTALERRFGAGTVHRLSDSARPITRIGLENLEIVSAFDPEQPADEEHAWIGVAIDAAEDVWVAEVDFYHFPGSAVRVGPRARRVTVDQCRSRTPVSEIGGYRRHAFLVEGQQVLVRDCEAEAGWNDFALGQLAAGPNVFLRCTARGAHADSGAFESWASGALYEEVRVEGAGIRLTKDWSRAQGAGWTAANSLIWNCEAESLIAEGPPGAANRVVRREDSLLARQAASRSAGPAAPRLPSAREDAEAVPLFLGEAPAAPQPSRPPSLEIVNGRLVIGGRTLWGRYADENWWRGQTYPAIAERLGGRSITRWVPGRQGPGLTEDLAAMAADYAESGHVFFYGGVGLWYDRRRDDHTVEPNDANVWAPFYEMPWARSGEGQAWDGLSRYDLSRFNPWFFERTRRFAEECGRQGLVHHHYLYNTHNVLETQSHWVDFPWRPANNINDTGLPEPPPLDANNTVHLADVFYNVDHPGRRALHRAYIFHTLDELAEAPNVIFSLGAQFAGPLPFQEFFLDTVREWEERTGRDVRLALVTSKDITDAILADPERAAQIDLIDMRYWQHRPGGEKWAPRGDRNLAFREMTTEQFGAMSDTPPPTTPWLAYRQVREYRDRFPDKALVVWHNGVDAVVPLMAGAAQVIMRYRAFQMRNDDIAERAGLDAFVRKELAPVLMRMAPRDGWLEDSERNWCLADDAGEHVLILSLEGEGVRLARELPIDEAELRWVHPITGKAQPAVLGPRLDGGAVILKPDTGPWLLWVRGNQG